MNRRSFVSRAAAAASGVLLGNALLPTRAAVGAECVRPAGVQLYTVRESLQRDPRSAIAALAALGLREGELFGVAPSDDPRLFGLRPRELKALVEQHGFNLPMSHIDGTLSNTAALGAVANELGIAALIIALPTEFTEMRDNRFAMAPAQSLEQMDRLAERLNRAGEEFRAQGLTFGYHNHHVEFIPVENRVPFDYLMANTDPDLVKIELDLGWLAAARADIVEYLLRYRGRVIACHLKDFKPPSGDVGGAAAAPSADATQLVEPGAGTIDFARVLDAMDEAEVPHGFIEIDVSPDPLGAVERGHRYLQTLLSC